MLCSTFYIQHRNIPYLMWKLKTNKQTEETRLNHVIRKSEEH